MPRNNKNADVDTPAEEETTATPEASADGDKGTAKAKGPQRGALPEGYVTPVGLAKVLGEKGLQKNREGEVLKEVKPQMVYSYMRNAPKDDPFPIETVKDDKDNERQAVLLEKGLAWWERKNERTATRKTNAAEKAKKAEERKAQKATSEAEAGEPTAEAEAE